MSTCIPKDVIKEVEDSGVFEIKDSLKREEALSKFFSKSEARKLNIRFEKTKLLKDSEAGVKKFIESQTEDGKAKLAELKAKMEKEFERKAKLLKELQDAGEVKDKDILDIEKVANDVFNKKHGLDLTEEQTNTVVSLTNEVSKASKLPKEKNGDYNIKYGQAIGVLDDYTASLKNPRLNMSLWKELGYDYNLTKKELDSIGSIPKKIGYIMSKVYNTSTSPSFKNMKATLDLSVLGIQGMAATTRNPLASMRAIKKSFKLLFSKDPQASWNAIRAKMFSGKNFNTWLRSGLRLIQREEQVQSTTAEKLGVFGKFIKRADLFFSSYLQVIREGEANRVLRNTEKKLGRSLDITDSNLPELIDKKVKIKIEKLKRKGKFPTDEKLKIAEEEKITERVTNSITSDSKLLKEIANHANKISGTTNLGPAERYASVLNKGIFAARFSVSDAKMYTDVLFNFNLSKASRIRAINTLALNWGTLFGSYLALSAIFPEKTDLRPNSANFMRVRGDNNVWSFPKPKGAWIIQVMSKIISGSELSSRGKRTVYGKGYNSKTRGDVVLRLLRSKASPQVSVATDLLTGSDFLGRKNTPARVITNLTAPIAASNIIERIFSNADMKDQFMLGFMDAAGINGWQRH